MSNTLTIQALIRRFEDKLRRTDASGQEGRAGNGPRFPMLTAVMGANAEDNRRALRENLSRLWPQYREELRFLLLEPCGESDTDSSSASFRCISEDGGTLDGDGVRRLASGLFGTDTHFTDYGSLLLFAVLDTGKLDSAAGLGRCLEAVRALKRSVRAEDVRELWILLLDEGHGKQRLGEELRRELARLLEKNTLPTILLLSSRRSDGRLDGDWTECCRVAADVMALANSPDGADLLRGGVLTASYHREEKPYSDISQLCVCALLDQFPDTGERPAAEDLRERLDLTREGTFRFVDRLDRSAYLPQPFQLELFPRPAPQRADWLRPDTTAREFNERTFGAWDCYLSQSMERAREDGPGVDALAGQYEEILRERFSPRELADLGQRREDVERWFHAAKPPSGELPVLAYGERYGQYLASADPALTEALLAVADRLAGEGRAFVNEWRSLLQTRAALYRVEDGDLSRFYENLLRDYFDGCGDALRREFRTVRTGEELEAFLDRAMEEMLRDQRFRAVASFGDELEVRWKTAAKTADANREIRQRLTGEDVPVFLLTRFSLGHPVRSFLLMETEKSGSLYADLRANLPEDTCFYDTGSGTAVEALKLYQVAREQLL